MNGPMIEDGLVQVGELRRARRGRLRAGILAALTLAGVSSIGGALLADDPKERPEAGKADVVARLVTTLEQQVEGRRAELREAEAALEEARALAKEIARDDPGRVEKLLERNRALLIENNHLKNQLSQERGDQEKKYQDILDRYKSQSKEIEALRDRAKDANP